MDRIFLLVILASALLPAAGALAAACLDCRGRAGRFIASATAVVGCLLGASASAWALLSEARADLVVPWRLAFGTLHLGLDALSSFFALCVFVVGLLSALFGVGYVSHLARHRPAGFAAAFFNALLCAMVLVILARDAFVFLVAWELMFVASFFLVTFEHDRAEVRGAGLTYLVASHAGVVALVGLVGMLSSAAGSLDFDALTARPLTGASATVAFALALVGFGVKAGFWPLHVWLPDAHPAAPSHVSALMSGAMIKLGIYGLLRFLGFLGPVQPAWGLLLVAVGAVTAVAGVLHALAQHDLKRLLAYCSVENVGLIALGVGLGLLGRAHGDPILESLGFAGALLHVLNHGLFKGLLFQGAGSVATATGSRELDLHGGLLRRMPVTGTTFLVGSAAITGLPPLNGFVSELLIFVAALRGASVLSGPAAVASLAAIAALGLVGGLAAACFAKAFGIVFLGEARTARALQASETSRSMRVAMACGAAACAAIGLWPRGALALVAPVAGPTSGAKWSETLATLDSVSRIAVCLLLVVLALAALRHVLLARRRVVKAPTWGCGYAHPTPRMQYTGSSFSAPALTPFEGVVAMHVERQDPIGYFPGEARYSDNPGDNAGERLLAPALRALVRALSPLRRLQRGRLQVYVLYIVVTLVVLVAWQLGGGHS